MGFAADTRRTPEPVLVGREPAIKEPNSEVAGPIGGSRVELGNRSRTKGRSVAGPAMVATVSDGASKGRRCGGGAREEGWPAEKKDPPKEDEKYAYQAKYGNKVSQNLIWSIFEGNTKNAPGPYMP